MLAVLVPIPLILIGARRGWRWTRKRGLRLTHLLMMGLVLLESLLGIACPMTVWEDELREKAAQPAYDRSFIAYWVGRILYYDLPSWVFTAVYFALALGIFILFRRVPPDDRKSL